MALDYSWGCDSSGNPKCFNTHGSVNPSDWTIVHNTNNCTGTYKPVCPSEVSTVSRTRKPPVMQSFKATTSWRGFVHGEMTTKSYFMLAGGAVIGALAARKLIKKGNKNTNTVIGGIVGLIAGYGATKIIK